MLFVSKRRSSFWHKPPTETSSFWVLGMLLSYRLRVGDLRVFFDVLLPERIIQVVDIENRGQAYRKKSRG
jgi:hypothetical protein